MATNAYRKDLDKAFSVGMNGHATKPIGIRSTPPTFWQGQNVGGVERGGVGNMVAAPT